MKIQLEHHARLYTLDLTQRGQSVTFTLDGKSYTVEILRAGEGWLDLRFSDSQSVSPPRFSDSNIRSSDSSAVQSVPPLRFSDSSAVQSVPPLRSSDSSAVQSVPPLRSSDSSAVQSVVVSVDGPKRWVTLNGQTFVLTQSTGPSKRGGLAHHAAGELLAPMPGQIRAVQAAEGDIVTKGQALVIVEAMKMEIKVAASFDGVVKKVNVKPGQAVEKDELLVEIESKIREDERR